MSAKTIDTAALAAAVETITGWAVRDEEMLRRALTHASASGAVQKDYQRLEFLGDRVLALIVAEMIYGDNPGASEGELSLRLNSLVNAETLAGIADETGLSKLIASAQTLKAPGNRKQVNMRADVTEALIAVLYLEGGLEAARGFIHRHWKNRAAAPEAARRDAKTALQEWGHQHHAATPRYTVDSRTGPDHDPLFEVVVDVAHLKARGQGRSKREAEQAAARALLSELGVWKDEETI